MSIFFFFLDLLLLLNMFEIIRPIDGRNKPCSTRAFRPDDEKEEKEALDR